MGAEVIELREFRDVPVDNLKAMARAAQKLGFELMFEFKSEPNMDEVRRLAPLGELASMDSMTRLWVLSEKAC